MTEAEISRQKWADSAGAWIASMGEQGDLSRAYILDPAMLELAGDVGGLTVADVGCGEGRFARMLGERGARVTGIDPTEMLVEVATRRDPEGCYLVGAAEDLPLASGVFDLAVSYLVLIDLADMARGVREMARILKPGGRLIVANLNPFVTAIRSEQGWVKDESGASLYFAVDDYFDERANHVSWGGISILNWHRTAETYFEALISAGLVLSKYREPKPAMADVEQCRRLANDLRVPLFHVMEWRKP